MAILLTQYGGLEIAEATDTIVARAAISTFAGAHRLADAVSGRDSAIQFDIFNRHVLDLSRRRGKRTQRSGAMRRGPDRYSQDWQESAHCR